MRRAVGLAVAVVLLSGAAVVLLPGKTPPAPRLATQVVSGSDASIRPALAPSVPQPVTEPATHSPESLGLSPPGWRARSREASDYYDLLRELLPAAEANDPEAQYVLANVLHECDDGYRGYFDRGDRRRSLDEALLWASTRPTVDSNDVRRIHARCERLMTQRARYGDSTMWRQRSAAHGFAPAQATVAGELLMSVMGTTADRSSPAVRESRAGAVEQLQTAVASGDPDVLWEIGELQYVLRGDVPDLQIDSAAWALAACRLGYDCSENARWYRSVCHFDPNHRCQPGEDGIELLKRQAQNDYLEIDGRAERIVALVRAGSVDELRRMVVEGPKG